MSDLMLIKLESQITAAFPHLKKINPIKMLGDGWANVVVEGNNGMVFRIPKNNFIKQQQKHQSKILPLLAKQIQRFDIPNPEVYLESSDAFPFGIMGYKKIEGTIVEPEQITTKNMEDVTKQVAELLLQFHRVNISHDLKNAGLVKTDYSRKKLQKTWNKSSHWIKENFSEKEYCKAQNFCREFIEYFETEPHIEMLVQGDAWYGNMLVNDDFRITGIVDFDKISIGDNAIDFVVQEYISTEFKNSVISEYQKLGGALGNHFDERFAYLKGIKALEDLNFCLYINHIYPHIPKRVRESLLLNHPH